ncbi:MAG: hypothetical protein OEU95_06280 [Nitrospirota bacterium]|nr:hypothetical protein [Nitrospirota bacterium]
MKRLRYIFYPVIGLPVLIILVWLIAVPTELIHEKIEDSIANTGNARIEAEVTGLRKGVLLSLYADAFELVIDKKPALSITEISFDFSPRYLLNGQLAFLIKGRTANGEINGTIKFPLSGEIRIARAELSEVPYLSRLGINISGNVHSDITIKDNTINVTFKVPDLNIGDPSTVIPLLNTFRKIQGSLSLEGNAVKISSISLEGDKGYARLKGTITNGVMDMALEIMPDMDKLKTMESMLIGKYIVSPGYYVVPIKGPMP